MTTGPRSIDLERRGLVTPTKARTCSPIAARGSMPARGGKVQYSGYQANAGYYVVIDQKGSGYGNMYAHLVRHSPLKTGDQVKTGQKIGNVGETGDAVGCHLHFTLDPAGLVSGRAPDRSPALPEEVGSVQLRRCSI